MSNERLGIVEQRGLDRERYGRFAYRAPVILEVEPSPPPTPAPVLSPAVAVKPKDPEIAELHAKIARLSRLLSDREREVADLAAQIFPTRQRIPIADVMARFCEIAQAEGYRIGNRQYTADDLLARRRSQSTSWPRHVCIDLVHRLSGASTNVIGRAFDGIDHTSVLHALNRTPDHLARVPLFATIHAKVLAAFEAQQ